MNAISHRTAFFAGALTISLAVAAGVYFAEPALFFTPLLSGLLYYFVQYPLLLFYVLLFSIPWSVEVSVTESLGTDLPDEPLMLLMAFVALLLLTQKKASSPPPFLLWLLVLTVAWSVVSVAASSHLMLSLKFFLARGWYLLAFAVAPLLMNGSEKLIKRSAVVLFSSTLAVTGVGLYQHAGLGFTFATINDAVAPFFRNHVNYSALLVCMIPPAVGFYRLEKNTVRRRLLLLSLAVLLAALYFSYARGAWLALVVGIISFWLLKRGWLLRGVAIGAIALTGFVFWLSTNEHYLRFAPHHDTTVFHQNFAEHLAATYRGNDVSTAERFHRWVAGARMSNERWLTGFGPTTFYQHYKSYTLPAFRTWVSDNPEQSTVHNYFLLLLIEQGVPGLALFLLLLGGLFWQAQKIYHRTTNLFWKTTVAAITAILAMQCTLNFLSDLIETDKAGSLFYLCLSFLIIAGRQTKKPPAATG